MNSKETLYFPSSKILLKSVFPSSSQNHSPSSGPHSLTWLLQSSSNYLPGLWSLMEGNSFFTSFPVIVLKHSSDVVTPSLQSLGTTPHCLQNKIPSFAFKALTIWSYLPVLTSFQSLKFPTLYSMSYCLPNTSSHISIPSLFIFSLPKMLPIDILLLITVQLNRIT